MILIGACGCYVLVFSTTVRSKQCWYAFFSVPNPPTVVCTEVDEGQITLGLLKPSGDVDKYIVDCNGEHCSGSIREPLANSNPTLEVFSNLAPFTDYTFKVTSARGNKQSGEVTTVCRTHEKGKSPNGHFL